MNTHHTSPTFSRSDPRWLNGGHLEKDVSMITLEGMLGYPEIFTKGRDVTRIFSIENGLAATSNMAAMVAILKILLTQ